MLPQIKKKKKKKKKNIIALALGARVFILGEAQNSPK
jgi:hypothetical protein